MVVGASAGALAGPAGALFGGLVGLVVGAGSAGGSSDVAVYQLAVRGPGVVVARREKTKFRRALCTPHPGSADSGPRSSTTTCVSGYQGWGCDDHLPPLV